MSSRYTRKRGPKPKPKTNTKPTKSRVQPKHVSKPGPRRRISAVNNVRGWRDIMAFEAKTAETEILVKQLKELEEKEARRAADSARVARAAQREMDALKAFHFFPALPHRLIFFQPVSVTRRAARRSSSTSSARTSRRRRGRTWGGRP
jgi:hypothetical protein